MNIDGRLGEEGETYMTRKIGRNVAQKIKLTLGNSRAVFSPFGSRECSSGCINYLLLHSYLGVDMMIIMMVMVMTIIQLVNGNDNC